MPAEVGPDGLGGHAHRHIHLAVGEVVDRLSPSQFRDVGRLNCRRRGVESVSYASRVQVAHARAHDRGVADALGDGPGSVGDVRHVPGVHEGRRQARNLRESRGVPIEGGGVVGDGRHGAAHGDAARAGVEEQELGTCRPDGAAAEVDGSCRQRRADEKDGDEEPPHRTTASLRILFVSPDSTTTR